jgi:hypothetical protein
MSFLSYSSINTLEEFSFVAGTEYTLSFSVVDDNGNSVSLNGGSVVWYLCPYGQTDYDAATVTGTITGTNTFTVVIPSAATLSLSGKYLQQPQVTDWTGKPFRPSQGVITIIPRIVP